MGMMNWRKGDDEADEEPADEDEFDLDDQESAVADALDDEWDDGIDDEWGDEFGGEDDALVHDLQDKVNGMETELGGVSSSMKTIKEENKRIAETVDELDDTIRKLLDVYEIVTRGINPFIDDAQAMANMNNEGSFGLFGDVEEETEDSLDPTLAGADAESFFDEEFDDVAPVPEEDDDGAGAAVDPADAIGAGPNADEATDDGADADETTDDGADSVGGVSFEDLKAEYEGAEDEDWEEASTDPADDAADDGDGMDDEEFADAHLDGESTDETVEFDDLEGLDDFDNFDADDVDEDGAEDLEDDGFSDDFDDGFGDEDDFDDEFSDDGFDDDSFDDDGFDDDSFDDDGFDDDSFDDDGFDDAGFDDDGFDDDSFDDDSFDDDSFDDEDGAGTDDAHAATDGVRNGSTSHGDARPSPRVVEPAGNASNGADGNGARGNGARGNGAHGNAGRDADGDYYLGRVPDDFLAELELMEWAEELVAVGGTAGAMDACRYYERLGWISPSVSDRLTTHVIGSAAAPDPDRAGALAVDDHVRSLGYVRRLGGDPSTRPVELSVPGGEYGGIRG